MCKYRLTDMTDQAKIISFANHKGGGKTTTTASVGFILAGLGKKVLLVDMDAQSNLTTSMCKGPPCSIRWRTPCRLAHAHARRLAGTTGLSCYPDAARMGAFARCETGGRGC